MIEKRSCTKDAGFTLIEIIAVLLILAVLAAVAIPRYLSLIDEARMKALEGALAAGYSQLSLTFAEKALADGDPPTAADVAGAVPDPAGDFGYDFDGDTAGQVTVTVTDPVDTTIKTNGVWTLP